MDGEEGGTVESNERFLGMVSSSLAAAAAMEEVEDCVVGSVVASPSAAVSFGVDFVPSPIVPSASSLAI